MNKITNIDVQKKNKNRVNIYVDNEFSFACDAELVYRFGLKKDMLVQTESIIAIADEDNLIRCKNSALKIIERNYKTEKEVWDKLLIKGFEEKTIREAISFLKEYNYLDDRSYCKLYIKDKISNQSRNKIYYSLLRKGVSEEILKDTIDSIEDNKEEEGAYALCKKKYQLLMKNESDEYKRSQKLFRFMAAKGYDFDMINKMIKKIIKSDQFME